ncbi:MAG: hypothetical protein NZL85_11930, partial [Fimbriimonadales bacterium]|nr:hypothetical protein [Fimbriimonadales bacterium]
DSSAPAQMRTAVLDIGSNSVLLLVAEYAADDWRILTDQTVITRLGEGFEPDRMLKPKAVRRTLKAIEQYLLQCRLMEVERVVAVATAVVRKAVNRESLLQPLQAIGCPVRVLSEQEEAELSFLAVALDPAMDAPPPNNPAPWLVIDIGGGSVEFTHGVPCRDTSKLCWRSLPVGAMSLREQLAPSNPPDPDEIHAVCQWLDEQLRFLSLLPPPEQVITVGGTGVNLALLWCGLHDMPATVEQVHGFRLTAGMLHEMLKRLLSLSDAERAQLPGIEPARAPLLHLGALILARALSAVNLSSVRVSTYGLRYGVLWRMAGNKQRNMRPSTNGEQNL